MYRYEDIQIVHLELTSRCNAACPMCARNIHGGKVNPHLPLTELSLEQVQKIFEPLFLKQLKKVYLCGNYGDPATAPDVIEIFRYFRDVNPHLVLGMHTNGGARDTKWWSQLASVVNYCRFGIDGLEDTNHLYRQGVRWARLMENVKAFIDAGGRAEWDYLVFAHNQHQVPEATGLANALGFKSFQVKSTSRFFDSKEGKMLPSYEVQNQQGVVTHILQPSDLPEYLNKALEEDYRHVVEAYGSVRTYWDKTDIECRTASEKSVYVTAQGHVFPCCWTANQMYPSWLPPKKSQIWSLFNELPGGVDSLSALDHPMKNIIEGSFFQSVLPDSWGKKSLAEGRLQVCAKTCGKCVKPFESQFIK